MGLSDEIAEEAERKAWTGSFAKALELRGLKTAPPEWYGGVSEFLDRLVSEIKRIHERTEG